MDIDKFEDSIGISFNSKDLLRQAFIHRSYINENPKNDLWHNERLEFLGDAVLELIVTEFLYEKYPDKNEGDLTAIRSALVNAVNLGKVADDLDFNNFIKLSKGEAKDTHRARSSILADAFEAVTGAIYLDKGYDTAKHFVTGTVVAELDNIMKARMYKDPKSTIQEKSQELLSVTPTYRLLSSSGPDHDKIFTVGIFFGEEHIATGEGKSKQDAETQAAKNALSAKKWE